MTNAKRPHSAGAKVRSILGWGALMAQHAGGWPANRIERELNRSLAGYPRNHTYRLCRGRMLPGFRLYERLRSVSAHYPESVESFLDVGCCRGYFVLEASGRPQCRVATGIDVHEPFISVANRVCRYLGIRTCRFHLAGLDDVSREPGLYGGPFQTVLMLGTYHYLYWGSDLCPSAYRSHREILARAAKVCAGTLIFSARLEINRLPGSLQEKAEAAGKTDEYNTSNFLETAKEFFQVREAGYLGKDRLLVMSKTEW